MCERECTVTMDQALSFPWVTHLIAAPSSLIPNSVGRACQTAYAEIRSDFEMLLMTVGYNYPLSFTPPHSFLSCPLLSVALAVTLSWFHRCSVNPLIKKMQGRKKTSDRTIYFAAKQSCCGLKSRPTSVHMLFNLYLNWADPQIKNPSPSREARQRRSTAYKQKSLKQQNTHTKKQNTIKAT